MAKQPEDKKTLDLIEQPKKRGRPATGNAKSAAERMKEMRARDRENGGATIKFSNDEIGRLMSALITCQAKNILAPHGILKESEGWKSEKAHALYMKIFKS